MTLLPPLKHQYLESVLFIGKYGLINE